jgi:hypothetical protein
MPTPLIVALAFFGTGLALYALGLLMIYRQFVKEN